MRTPLPQQATVRRISVAAVAVILAVGLSLLAPALATGRTTADDDGPHTGPVATARAASGSLDGLWWWWRVWLHLLRTGHLDVDLELDVDLDLDLELDIDRTTPTIVVAPVMPSSTVPSSSTAPTASTATTAPASTTPGATTPRATATTTAEPSPTGTGPSEATSTTTTPVGRSTETTATSTPATTATTTARTTRTTGTDEPAPPTTPDSDRQPDPPLPRHWGGIHRITNGSGRATEIDTASPIGEISAHGVRIYCVISHFSHDDPIVFPNRAGAAHGHMFWGNTGTDHTSTGASLLAGGNSSCEGGTNNRSSYWIPSLHDEAGAAVLPESVFVYYKSFGGPRFDRSTIRPIPAGLEMLATREVARSGDHHVRVGGSATEVQLHIAFPECVAVDRAGRPVLTSADNVSHVSYAGGGGPTGCPATHPYRIPQLSYVVRFAVPFPSNWSLSSDHHHPGGKGDSLHADYIAAWDQASMDAITECVVVGRRNCGFAGGRGQLPERFTGQDGSPIYSSSVDLAPGADRTPFGVGFAPMLH
ncbi:MAG: DUF1996 domain-containing protein [Actinomycetota bacterium]